MLPSTATPSAVESCCTASKTPEADPTSSMFTLVRMNWNSCPRVVPTPARRFNALPAERFPETRRYGAELTSGTGHERFDFTLGLIIDNLT